MKGGQHARVGIRFPFVGRARALSPVKVFRENFEMQNEVLRMQILVCNTSNYMIPDLQNEIVNIRSLNVHLLGLLQRR